MAPCDRCGTTCLCSLRYSELPIAILRAVADDSARALANREAHPEDEALTIRPPILRELEPEKV